MRKVSFPNEIDGIKVVQDEVTVAKCLNNGEKICRFEWGDSMRPILRHGEYAVVIPISEYGLDNIKRGDAVFCKMSDINGNSYYMTHMVWEISYSGYDGAPWFKIGSSNNSIYGWTQDILGYAKGMDVFEDEENFYKKLPFSETLVN